MDKERFRECLQTLHWPSATLAEVLNTPLSTCMDWLLGRSEVPPQVALWLETLTRAHMEAPLPSVEAAPAEDDTSESEQVSSDEEDDFSEEVVPADAH
jgi:hypothetical protein